MAPPALRAIQPWRVLPAPHHRLRLRSTMIEPAPAQIAASLSESLRRGFGVAEDLVAVTRRLLVLIRAGGLAPLAFRRMSMKCKGRYGETAQARSISEQHALESPLDGRRADSVHRGTLQALVDQSPRVLAQRRAIQHALGDAFQQGSVDRRGESVVQEQSERSIAQHGNDTREPPAPGQRDAPSSTAAVAAPNQTGMPDQLKAGIEALSRIDVSDLRVHRNSDKPAQLNALAYAQGNDIHLAAGQEHHLPHEAWHVVQQRQGRVRETMRMAGVGINDDPGLEREADSMGSRAASQALGSLGDIHGYSGSRQGATQAAGSASQSKPAQREPIVQRAFGFEMELPAVVSRHSGGHITQPAGPVLADRGTFEIKKDHMNETHVNDQLAHLFPNTNEGKLDDLKFTGPSGPPIIELVNKKMDESALSEVEVGDQMQAMADFADSIFVRTASLTKLAVLDGDLHVGANGSKKLDYMRGNAQATYGVRLSAVPEAMKWHDAPRTDNARATVALQDATSFAAQAILELTRSHGLQPQDAPQLQGLIAMLCSYLIAGQRELGSGALVKRRLGALFYKTHLNELRLGLGKTDGTGLYIENNKATIKAEILNQVGVAADKDMFSFVKGFTCGEWIDGILSGTEDAITEGGINQYSTKLGPDTLGTNDPEIGPVMENRELDLIFAPDKSPQWYRTSRWADLGKAIYRKLRALNRTA